MSDIITLTTDLGADDAYVAAMKGVILSINPRAMIVDVCHSIAPQSIGEGAFVLSTVHRYFPAGTVHVVVVDPGVGTRRRAVLLQTDSACFVAPDNGVLSYIAAETTPDDREIIELTNDRLWRQPVSATFHGRDIFAPVAAYLSIGVPPRDFGPPLSSMVTIPIPRPETGEDRVLIGHIVHIDHFGNLITDVTADDLPRGNIYIGVGGHFVEGLSASYQEGEEVLAIIGSSDRMEISLRNGNAATLLGARVGDQVRIKRL